MDEPASPRPTPPAGAARDVVIRHRDHVPDGADILYIVGPSTMDDPAHGDPLPAAGRGAEEGQAG